ncbi:unnamed protein product [Caenorhabditis angaria]|uniref:Uncharacterized protein n=1 Tax=Caenorhabditis angaria TaxID=860376 RepID=A0A9P1IB13_9PELO|nr:unnamed protein product [Caenorhabditis angaria]
MNPAQEHIAWLITNVINKADSSNAKSIAILGTQLETLGGLLRDFSEVTLEDEESIKSDVRAEVGKLKLARKRGNSKKGTMSSSSSTEVQPAFVSSDVPSTESEPLVYIWKYKGIPLKDRPCTFCEEYSHKSEDCYNYPSFQDRYDILNYRGYCTRCCTPHQSSKCPEMRPKCQNCPRGTHSTWLCPAIQGG